MKNPALGFTLVELMVAMTLTVIIGSVSYRFLDSAIDASTLGVQKLERLNAMERFWTLLTSDLTNIADRVPAAPAIGIDALQSIRSGAGLGPVMLSEIGDGYRLESLTERDDALIWFARHGWSNPLGTQRSQVQRVLYRLDDGVIRREYWAEFNQSFNMPPIGSVPLIDGVEELTIRYLPFAAEPVDVNWLPSWPPVGSSAMSGFVESANEEEELILPRRLPAALEVTVLTESFGEIRRVLMLPSG